VIAMPVALVLAFFSDRVLWAWTGDAEIAREAASVLTLYALGNGILVLAAFPYYLQFAKGDLTLHLIGNALFVGVFVPILFWATWKYGMVGAGYAWLIANLITFFFWLPIVHARLVKGLHIQWMLRDVGVIVAAPLAAAFLLHELLVWPATRFSVAIDIVAVSLGLFAIAAASSSWVRETIISRRPIRLVQK
jgi:O-antigen/teichoic acid export membrane protein